jgi:hypothetical protein
MNEFSENSPALQRWDPRSDADESRQGRKKGRIVSVVPAGLEDFQ